MSASPFSFRPDDRTNAGGKAADGSAPFDQLGAGWSFLQDWLKAAGSALPHMPGLASAPGGIGAWGLPTIDPEELDKRIQELRTVQFWLEQNARMIAMTIQGLEVQKMTLSTLQGMNVSMDKLRESLQARGGDASVTRADANPPKAAARSPWPDLGAAWRAPASHAPSGPSTSHVPNAPGASSPSAHDEDLTPGPAEGPSAQPAQAAQAAQAADSAQTPGGAAGAELINPMRWWDTLTEQFNHLASQASQTAQTMGESVGASMQELLKPASKSATRSASHVPGSDQAPAATVSKRSGSRARATAKTTDNAAPSAKPRARASAKVSAKVSKRTSANPNKNAS